MNRKTAVMYGAGNIGRGFIGQVFFDSGFEVVFIDIDCDVVAALNERGSYTQLIIEGDSSERREISRVRAVDGFDREAVASEIAACDIMAVSVGAAVLPVVAPVIAEGLELRGRSFGEQSSGERSLGGSPFCGQPLNILVCENLAHAPEVLRGYVSDSLSDISVLDRVGFVGTTIGRMVPFVSKQERADDPTLIAVEGFCTLPMDADAVILPMPELQHTFMFSPFAFEEQKKLFIHNMGHSLAAYLGALKGYEYIWQVMDDSEVRTLVLEAMKASAEALASKYNEDRSSLSDYVNDLISRFGNKGLGDTVARVGGDPLRKLSPGDRFMGTIDLYKEQGIDYRPVLIGVAAALRFDAPDDPSADLMRQRMAEFGVFAFLRDYCGMVAEDAERCIAFYESDF